MHATEWFQDTEQVPIQDRVTQTALITRMSVATTSVLVLVWLALGVTPADRTARLVLAFLVVVAVALASGALLGFVRLSPQERTQHRWALATGITTFGLAALVAVTQVLL